MHNQTLTIKTDYQTCGQVTQKIKLMSDLFLKTFRKGAKCELVYSLMGDKKKPCHSLAVWHDGSQEQLTEIEFFKKNL